MIWWLAFEKRPFQFWREIQIQVLVILLAVRRSSGWSSGGSSGSHQEVIRQSSTCHHVVIRCVSDFNETLTILLSDSSDVYVLLVSVFWYTNCQVNFSFFWSTKFFFGIPIIFLVDEIGFFGWPNWFFGQPNFFLVYQFFFGILDIFLVDQIFFWSTKKMRNWPDNWYTKETDQKYMDATSM